MQIHTIPRSLLKIPPDRQRRNFSEESIVELAESIIEFGLIHPPVVRKESSIEGIKYYLVAGERRLKAMEYVWMLGKHVVVAGSHLPTDHVPCLLFSELSALDAFGIELDENIKREDLSVVDRARAISQLMEFRKLQAATNNEPAPTIETLGREIWTVSPTAKGGVGAAHTMVKDNLMVARNSDDLDVQKAKSLGEAVKIIKRKEEIKKSAALAASVGRSFTRGSHDVLHGNCLELLKEIHDSYFDVVLTDPPYGMGADEFGDSGGKAKGSHFYDDSYETWYKLMWNVFTEFRRVTKPNSHLYLFCDIDRFPELKTIAGQRGFKPFRTPLIWVNPRANRVPWVDSGPQRKWQAILYATKGSRQVRNIRPDVLTYTSDFNLNHQAQKPVALFKDLLERSCQAGDTVLDPFCGTGPIFPAAHELKVKATGIEQDDAAYGIALNRIRELK